MTKESNKRDDRAAGRVKDFLEQHFDLKELRNIGMFTKDIKRNDYGAMAARLCLFFGYESIFEHRPLEIEEVGAVGIVTIPATVDGKGQYHEGESVGWLSLGPEPHFSCPACTCENVNKRNPSMRQRCVGCKRMLMVVESLHETRAFDLSIGTEKRKEEQI